MTRYWSVSRPSQSLGAVSTCKNRIVIKSAQTPYLHNRLTVKKFAVVPSVLGIANPARSRVHPPMSESHPAVVLSSTLMRAVSHVCWLSPSSTHVDLHIGPMPFGRKHNIHEYDTALTYISTGGTHCGSAFTDLANIIRQIDDKTRVGLHTMDFQKISAPKTTLKLINSCAQDRWYTFTESNWTDSIHITTPTA